MPLVDSLNKKVLPWKMKFALKVSLHVLFSHATRRLRWEEDNFFLYYSEAGCDCMWFTNRGEMLSSLVFYVASGWAQTRTLVQRPVHKHQKRFFSCLGEYQNKLYYCYSELAVPVEGIIFRESITVDFT